ncbi:hypothetical protein BJ170DRAFT_215537 [Xylariales sp. AK1849]|nr:hypothetical protein BJ170DRAFT_215537 [Xylariales sp. AK1849]
MAFRQPTRQAAQRVFRPTAEEEPHRAPQLATQSTEESQTWVLFSPATEAGTTTSYLTETHHTKSTPGRSRLSDLGSLNTVERSENSAYQQRSASFDALDEEDEEDDAELDSLDGHLPEFRSTPNLYNPSQGLTPIVPAHDGLGLFRLDHEGMGSDAQDKLYAFEKYNPRRVKRRRESLELAQVELEREQGQEMDKMQRIETWRLEQSRYLLDEIQKETRRRRHSTASATNVRSPNGAAENAATFSDSHDAILGVLDEGEGWHDQQAGDLGNRESIWGRITRKVIRDIMGIDDKLLSVLFGESLPDEDDLSATPKASTMLRETSRDTTTMAESSEPSWQLKLLERIAKELGIFVYQLSEHPGAFSTFTRMQQMPIAYAGLASIPETANDMPQASSAQNPPATMPEFKPTVVPQSRPIDVPGARAIPGATPGASHAQGEKSASSGAFTQEEWEQDLDVRLVFRYLRSRFMSLSSSSGSIPGTSHLATSSTQDAAARAARVRQHHPLVSKSRPSERRSFKATTPSSPVLFRHASSCTSQSTRRSVRRSSCSSRHYWDIGAGSVGTGSMIAAAGPMGSWGEI